MFPGQVLGIEGTAWNLSAAVFDSQVVAEKSKPYSPPQGGIHPREAAQHHATHMAGVIGAVLTAASSLEGIAFSQGPGLGPCLRTVATAARALAGALHLPLVGVNHCVAHVEIGRYDTGCKDPIVLYVSGANTQVIGYLTGRYRVLGETLDIGLGNALDKFARGIGLPHPGGPAIERLACQGRYRDLPYTVKGMDLAFSGLVSAAQGMAGDTEDACHSIQEVAFAMCVEVTERALAHTGKEEVLLVGGVGVNHRLQDMLGEMCEERGATLHVPKRQFMGDNGAMIAYTGGLMLASGQAIPIRESRVIPTFRADQVDVNWRERDPCYPRHEPEGGIARGAEAVVAIGSEVVEKQRSPKGYRHRDLDQRLIAERTKAEARLMVMARRAGVSTPIIHDIDGATIVMERVYGPLLRDALTIETVRVAGRAVGRLHTAGIVHGDLTTSNMILRNNRCIFIDFGLSAASMECESRGVDVHVFVQALTGTARNADALVQAFIEGYREEFAGADEVLARVDAIVRRGRYL